MALKKEAIDKLSAYGIDVTKLTEAIKADGEVDFTIPDAHVFTEAELTSRDNSKLEEGKKEGQKIGETIGKELAAKEMKKHFGVEFEGKDLAKLVETVKTQLAKGDDGLKEQIKLLQKAVEEKDLALTEAATKAEAAIFDATLLSELPSNRSALFNDQEYLTVLKANLQFDKEGVKKNGQLVRDSKTQNPIERKQAISDFFSERKWVSEVQGGAAGRGAGNQQGNTLAKKRSEVEKEWVSSNPGKTPMSPEFMDHLSKVAKEVEGFDMYN
jgi:hypothetical protein